MGFFTWTDARREPRLLKNGDYSSVDKIGYDSFAKIVCPDNTEICEPYYEGYGMFDGQDIYDLVVDWNKDHLDEIFNRLAQKNPKHWGWQYRDLAICYQNDNKPGMNAEIKRLGSTENPCFQHEWKRNIGIAIACDKENNKALPFPIKITSTKKHKTYNELVPSCICQ